LIAIVGYLTIAPADAATIAGAGAPPFAIPAALPTSSAVPPAAAASPADRTAIDQAAAAAVAPAARSLP